MLHSQLESSDSVSPSTLATHSNSTSTSTTTAPGTTTSTTTTNTGTTLRSRSKSIPSSNDSSSSNTTSSTSSPRPPHLDFTHSSYSSFSLSQQSPTSKSNPKSNHHSKRSSSSLLSMLVSPRSSNYAHLEGGHGPARLAKRRFTWQKFAIAAVVIIGLVWLFGPRRADLKDRVGWGNDSATPYEDDLDVDVDDPPLNGGANTHPYIPPPKVNPSPAHTGGTTTDVEKPLTYDTDPDRSSTTHCTTPHPSKSTLVQWSLMIDAGSTGSRIHIYKFNNCGASPAYEYEVFVKNQKGLSAYAGRAVEAAMSLDELLDEATKVVPKAMWGCTPVNVKATAGLRLLGPKDADDILKAVEKRLRDEYPFSVAGEGAVGIMDGKDEGVYAWITANYLLGTIGGDSSSSSSSSSNSKSNANANAKETYAVLDLGGASTQIVFKPEFGDTKSDGGLEAGEHKYDLKFGGEEYVLYQHSYLGYGLMQARRHTHALVEFMDSIRPGGGGKGLDSDGDGDKDKDENGKDKDGNGKTGKMRRVANPCLARGTEREVDYFDEERRKEGKVVMYGGDVGSFEACERVMALVLAKDAICETKPCSFNGVYQPSLLDTFKHGKVLLLSYFYDRIEPLLPLLVSSTASSTSSSSSSTPQPTLDNLPISTLTTLASHLCSGLPGWTTAGWTSSPTLLHELHDRPEWCLDMTFMHALLRLGYEFGDEREVRVGKQVGGTELGWALGAGIVGLGGEVKCRV